VEQDLREMIDHFQIRKLLAQYCRGSDRADEPLMASIYAEDSWDDHGIVQAPGAEYSRIMCQQVEETTESLSHHLGQSLITIDGDSAGAETYFIAVARDTAEDGTPMCNQLGGRFVDQLIREDGRWKVKHRKVLRDWSVAIPLHHDWVLSNTLTAGQRSDDDHSYAVLGTTHGGRGG
jgi:hypothetical protein